MNRRTFIKTITFTIAGISSILSFHFIKDFFFRPSIKKRTFLGLESSIISQLESSPSNYFIDPKNRLLLIFPPTKKVQTFKFKNIKAFSLVCPHLGCTLAPNSTNSELLCPCHGSSFKFLDENEALEIGKLINGPANKNIEEFKLISIDNKVYLEA